MNRSEARSQIYSKFEKTWTDIEKFLNLFEQSNVLQEYVFKHYQSLIYANMVSNFFTNLNSKKVKEQHLPSGKIGKIWKRYRVIRDDLKKVKDWNVDHMSIDKAYYKNFKSKLKRDFPEFTVILREVEAMFDLLKVEKHLSQKQKALRKLGKRDVTLDDKLVRLAIERYFVKGKGRFRPDQLSTLIKKVINKDLILKFAEGVYKDLEKNASEMLQHESLIRLGFESRLYWRWKVPLDKLESMIVVARETGERKKNNLAKEKDKSNYYRHSALIRIHARSLLLSSEILTLLRAGYPDGAFARWRSLHELAIISIFLNQNSEVVSQRYIDHSQFKDLKDALDYQLYAKKLGYHTLPRGHINRMKRHCNTLTLRHGPDFTKGDYDWIPRSIIAGPNFRELEKHIRMDRYRPYYNMSSTAVHGGSKALLHSLALMKHKRNKLLLVGPSNYGLADPIQTTSRSLMFSTMSLLTLKPDLEDSIALSVLSKYASKIGRESVEVQKQIEKEEREMRVEQRTRRRTHR